MSKDVSAPLLEGRPANGLSPEAAAALAARGFVLYRDVTSRDARSHTRARKRLHSAKIVDADNAFLCEATVHDVSAGGMGLVLARNIGLPPRFGVHDDLSGEMLTVSQVWRRGFAIGVRIHARAPPRPMRPVERAALAGRYYGVRD